MATAPTSPTSTTTGNEMQQNVQRGLEYLKGSDQIIGDIVAYCVSAYKADPQAKTLERIRQYVQDTANSVSEHVLTIAHNISKMLEQETREIEQLSYEAGFSAQRLQISQSYMCELFMTKFQVYPRPRKTVHMTRKTIPEDQLPKHSRPKRWVREKAFDYTILDGISNDKQPTVAKQRSVGGDVPYFSHMPSVTTMHMGASGAPPLLSQTADTTPKVDLSYPKQPSIPTMPSIPSVPSVPSVPTVPSVPSIPGVPAVPAIPKTNTNPPVPPLPSGGGSAIGGAPEEPPEELKPFLKMLKVGVPRSGVETKMHAAGVDPALLEKFVDGGQAKAGGGNPAASRPPNPMAAALKARSGAQPSANSGGPPALPPIPGNNASGAPPPPPVPRS